MFRFKPPAQISGAICDVLCPPTAEEALRLLTNTRRTLLDSPLLPELFGENLATINVFPETGVPFSARINSLVSHATFQRLKCELQLGWISQVFPGALHTRWVHSLGVFNIVRRIYVALISDEFNPIAAVYLQLSDVANALVAALIHDLGQTAFAHAIEEVDTALYKHEEATVDLLDETCHLTAGQPSLWGVIQRDWSSVGISKQRILYICGSRLAGSNYGARDLAVDSLARDLVAGVIDGDRLDYLRRDSLNCGVPYGNSVDIDRLLSSLSVAVENKPQLRLGFDAKGLSAIESLLWARYQMFNAVYWHHTYRGIQALFFAALEGVRFCSLDAPAQHRFFYQYVVLRQSRRIVQSEVLERMNPVECAARFDEVEALTEDRALHFVFVLGNSRSCELVRRLACRNYYKVIFERRVRSYIEAQMPSTRRVPEKLKAGQRTAVAERIGRQFIERINAERNQRKAESMSEMAAFATLDIQSHVPWVLLDFPTRGNTPDQVGFPLEIPNVSRKYGQLSAEVGDNGSIFLAISRFLFESSWVRVYVEPVLHSLITDYLTEDTVAEVIGKEIKGELFTKP
jgi:HD superfamily phosphohydrolase